MSERSAFMASLNQASSALNVFALKAHFAAYNIAYVSTPYFKPVRLNLATGPDDRGVMANGVKRLDEPGLADSDKICACDDILKVSGTDLAEEFVHLLEAKTSFISNAKVVGVVDELSESLLNIKT